MKLRNYEVEVPKGTSYPWGAVKNAHIQSHCSESIRQNTQLACTEQDQRRGQTGTHPAAARVGAVVPSGPRPHYTVSVFHPDHVCSSSLQSLICKIFSGWSTSLCCKSCLSPYFGEQSSGLSEVLSMGPRVMEPGHHNSIFRTFHANSLMLP